MFGKGKTVVPKILSSFISCLSKP